MGSSPSKERYQLFQRTGSTKWQMRFNIKGQGQIGFASEEWRALL